MKEEKISKQKPHTFFNRRLSVVKKTRGEHDNGQEKFKNLILYGEHNKGGYGKGYYGILLNLTFRSYFNLKNISNFIKINGNLDY